MARQQRDLKREQSWRRHIEQQHASGLTVRVYCDAHPLRETSFYFWRQEIAKRDRESAARPTDASPVSVAPAFVPVAVIDPPAAHNETPIDIRLTAGHRVRVRAGCDRALLADVLALLRQPMPEGRPC
jgi:hypothetical protein